MYHTTGVVQNLLAYDFELYDYTHISAGTRELFCYGKVNVSRLEMARYRLYQNMW